MSASFVMCEPRHEILGGFSRSQRLRRLRLKADHHMWNGPDDSSEDVFRCDGITIPLGRLEAGKEEDASSILGKSLKRLMSSLEQPRKHRGVAR